MNILKWYFIVWLITAVVSIVANHKYKWYTKTDWENDVLLDGLFIFIPILWVILLPVYLIACVLFVTIANVFRKLSGCILPD